MEVAYGTSAFERDRGNFPALPVVNMFAEEVPTEGRAALQSRPGLENTGTTLGAGPVKALYQIDGVLNGGFFAISGNQLYKDGVSVGTLDGSDPARIAGYETYIFANQGESLYGYDGTNYTTVSTPDNFSVQTLCVGSSRLIVINKDTGRFYWSDVLDSNIGALSFATAENSPDKLKDCLYLGDTLILFGSETVEFWPVTGSAASPFEPLVGRVFQTGIRDTGCATLFGPAFAWITNLNQVCVSDPENIVSFPGLEAKIEDSVSVSMWTFRLEGAEFLAVRLDNETWVMSTRNQSWSVFESAGANWIPQCYAQDIFGSSVNGSLIQWTDDYSDFGSTLERRFRAGVAMDAGSVPLSNVTIRTNPGQTSFLTGTYDDPTISLRTSKDGGHNWSNWRERSLGEQGEYRPRIQWLSLGYFSQPGALIEFRITDPVPFRMSGINANEPYGSI